MLEYIGNGVYIGFFLFHLFSWLCCVFAVYKQAASFLVFYRGIQPSISILHAYKEYPHPRKFLLLTCLAVLGVMTLIFIQAFLILFLMPEWIDGLLGSFFPFLFYLAMALQLYTSSIRYEHLCIDIKHSSKIKKRVWLTRWFVLVVCGESGISGTVKIVLHSMQLGILNNVADFVGMFMNLMALGLDAFMNISMIRVSLRPGEDITPSPKTHKIQDKVYPRHSKAPKNDVNYRSIRRKQTLRKPTVQPVHTHSKRWLYTIQGTIILVDLLSLAWFAGILFNVIQLDPKAKPQNVAVSMILFHCLGCLYLLHQLREKVILAKNASSKTQKQSSQLESESNIESIWRDPYKDGFISGQNSESMEIHSVMIRSDYNEGHPSGPSAKMQLDDITASCKV